MFVLWKDRKISRTKDRQTDSQKDRQTERETEGQDSLTKAFDE